jgi:Carboxymuconolactone decarboxylase family
VRVSAQHAAIATTGAFTAVGDLPRLETALHKALEAGVTVNQVKEVLVQMYAYAGFPRALNGIATFMTVLEQRTERGVTEAQLRGLAQVLRTEVGDQQGDNADRILDEVLKTR